MPATCIYRIWVRQSNKLNVLPGIGYLTTRDLEQYQKIKVKYFKDTFPEKKDIILITPWWHSSFLQGKRWKTRVAYLKSGVMFKGKASFKACLFGRIQVSILISDVLHLLRRNTWIIANEFFSNIGANWGEHAGLIFLQENRCPRKILG